MRNCETCGGAFKPRHSTSRFCSVPCRNSFAGSRRKTHKCTDCGGEFIGGNLATVCPACRGTRKRHSRQREYRKHRETYLARNRRVYQAQSDEERRAERERVRFNGARADRLARDRHRCVLCGTDRQIIVHHLNRRDDRNKTDRVSTVDDLMTLCRGCHLAVHRWQGDIKRSA